MNKKTEKKNFKFFDKKTTFVIALLAMADVLVFIFPSYLRNVISSEVIALNLGVSTSELAQAAAIYGFISLAIYFFGSILGDKFSVKWLTIFGLAAFGISGAWYGSLGLTAGGAMIFDKNGHLVLNPSGQNIRFIQLCIIYSIWAVAKVIFWAPLWKLLSQQGKAEQNGALNGVHGTLNGFIGTIFVAVGYLIFFVLTPVFVNNQTATASAWAFSIMCWIFSGLIAITVVMLIFFVKEDKARKQETADFKLKNVVRVLKNKKLWLVSFAVMGVYMYQQGLSILVPYLQFSLGVAAIAVFIGGLLRTYIFRFIFSAPAGKIADKSGKYVKFLMVGILIGTGLLSIVTLLPGFKVGWIITKAPIWYLWLVRIIVYAFFLCLGGLCWGLVTNRWATLFEIGIEKQDYATAVGVVSVIAFTPDAWFQQLQSYLIKIKGVKINGIENNQIAYQYLMLTIIIGGMVGFFSGASLLYLNKKEKQLLSISPTKLETNLKLKSDPQEKQLEN